MAKIQAKRGLQEAVTRPELAEGELVVVLDTGNTYVGTASGKMNIDPTGGTVDTVERLKTPRAFSTAGDATIKAVNFNGSTNVRLRLVLAALSGLKAGTYTKVTVSTKGRVTAGQMLEASDIPSISSSGVTGLGTAAATNIGAKESNMPVVQVGGKLLASLLPDLSDTYVFVTTIINGKPLGGNTTLAAGDVGAVLTVKRGVTSGIITLGSDGKVPAAQLPNYVGDMLELENWAAFPEEGEDGKIYAAEDTNLTRRWSDTRHVEISPSPALSEISSTAYPGDKGRTTYDHSQVKTGNLHGTVTADVGAAPMAHTGVAASASQLGHVRPGTEFKMGGDDSLSLSTVDDGVFE